MKYTQHITNTPQTRPLIGRTDMVKNSAGGYGFSISPQERLERFIMLGTEGGTYYASEKSLTVDNAKNIIDYIKQDGRRVINTAVESIVNNRAPKIDAALFVIALCMTYGNAETRKCAHETVPTVCRTATQLFTLVGNVNTLRGWSRGLRRNVAKWYTQKTADQLAYQLVKYRQRNGWCHRDVIRLSHPKSEALNSLLRYAVGKAEAADHALVQSFTEAMSAKGKDLVRVIEANPRLTWEMVPLDQLNDPHVLTALAPSMPITATIRNLNRFANAGLTDVNSEIAKVLVAKLTNKEELKKARLHPVNVVNSMMVYARGHGFKGNQRWTANQRIVDALSKTYDLAIDVLPPSNKNILVGVDISASMGAGVGGTAMSAIQFANVLALTMLKCEPNAEVMAFDTNAYNIKWGSRSSLDEVLRMSAPGGGTDCSMPIAYAIKKRLKMDGIVILTDSESWAGNKHSFKLLEEYRNKLNPEVKVIEVASTATGNSQFPSEDKNLMRVAGFDSSVLNLISLFLGQTALEAEVA